MTIEVGTEPSAHVVADSINKHGDRLTSVQATGHRFILAEVNTHCVQVRSSASSRAIPLKKQLAKVREDTAVPVEWISEQRGMQGGEPLAPHMAAEADRVWYDAAEEAGQCAEALGMLGVHKSLANRLLEPFLWHTMLITATAWQNMFDQRVHPDAQPEFREMATRIKEAMDASEPRLLQEGEWHLPYVDSDTWCDLKERHGLGEAMYPMAVKVSTARCARNSYETQDGKRDLSADLDLYEKLTTERFEKGDVPHWTPLEHVATPCLENRQTEDLWVNFDGLPASQDDYHLTTDHLPKVGRLLGWISHRHLVEARQQVVTFR